jgi:chitodextrinase
MEVLTKIQKETLAETTAYWQKFFELSKEYNESVVRIVKNAYGLK